MRGEDQAQCRDGQHRACQELHDRRLVARRHHARRPPERHRKDEDQDRRGDEFRNGHREDRRRRDGEVERPVAIEPAEKAEKDRNRNSDDGRGSGKHDGIAQTPADDFGDRLFALHGGAEIACENAARPFEEAFRRRAIEPHALAAILECRTLAFAAEKSRAGIARHEFEAGEDHDRDEDQREDRRSDALEDQPQHGRPARRCYSALSTRCQRM